MNTQCLLNTVAAAALVACATQASATAGLAITQTTDIAAGQAAFGPAQAAFDWSRVFATGTEWTFGALGPTYNGPIGFPMPWGSWVMAAAGSSFHVGNWIDGNGFTSVGSGFNAAGGMPAPELAVNGAESFSLTFAEPVHTVGLTVASGLSNLPTEVNHDGAVFQLSTDSGVQGTLTLTDTGAGYSAWVTIASNIPFTTLTFFEPSGDVYDQYFGNVFVPVPEADSLSMLLLGLAGVSVFVRRQVQCSRRLSA